MRPVLPILASALLLCAACASTGEGRRSSGDANRITREQIDESKFTSTYDVVRSLRPQWLRKRGETSVNNPTDVVVYQDHTRLGGPQELRGINTIQVGEIVYLPPMAASNRYGMDHGHGAIVVITRSR